jgi:hypothetical protein
MTDPATIRRSWQSAPREQPPSLEDVRKGADKFHRFVRLRNWVEYAAGVVVVISFSTYAFVLEPLLVRIGSALVVLGTFYAMWQLHRRASAVSPAASWFASAMPCPACSGGICCPSFPAWG